MTAKPAGKRDEMSVAPPDTMELCIFKCIFICYLQQKLRITYEETRVILLPASAIVARYFKRERGLLRNRAF